MLLDMVPCIGKGLTNLETHPYLKWILPSSETINYLNRMKLSSLHAKMITSFILYRSCAGRCEFMHEMVLECPETTLAVCYLQISGSYIPMSIILPEPC